MRLSAEIAGERHEAEIRVDGARVLAEVDGRSYQLEVSGTKPGSYLLMLEGRIYECRVEAGGHGAADVHVGGHTFAVTLIDPKRLQRGGRSAGAAEAGTDQIVAPMPGKVVRVLVEQGAAVEAGDAVVVVEAMKMQNELKAPRAGIVSALHAQTGTTVGAGEVLAVIE